MSISDGHPVTDDNAVVESHDVSPDGRWIAYNSNLRGNSDIYKKPLDGGNALPITDSPDDEFRPQWSPDGTEISFTSDRRGAVMVVPSNGGMPYQLTTGTLGGYWSPSGLDMVFTRVTTGPGEVSAWIVSRDALGESWGEASQLTDIECVPTDWARDGSRVLCETGAEIVQVSREGNVTWRYDLAAAGLVPALSATDRFSWDGSLIYHWGSHEDGSSGIWAIPVQGGKPSLVVSFDDAEIVGIPNLSVGPEHLYYTVGQYESDIWVMDVEVER
jgi:hypothetical protein